MFSMYMSVASGWIATILCGDGERVKRGGKRGRIIMDMWEHSPSVRHSRLVLRSSAAEVWAHGGREM